MLICTVQVQSMVKEIARLREQLQASQNLDSDDNNVSQVSSLWLNFCACLHAVAAVFTYKTMVYLGLKWIKRWHSQQQEYK